MLVLVLFAAGVAASSAGDDFANNLFTDLAPLLTLFGERVTSQFISQSMGWADNVILVMAPLGIVTIVISAIRVGGPQWLKAIIGRARENLAVAEVELMSSTSEEVCELWNGQAVVRCMGKGQVWEFICLLPAESPSSTSESQYPGITSIKVDSAEYDRLDDDQSRDGLMKTDLSVWNDFMRWRSADSMPESVKSPKETEPGPLQSESDIVIIRLGSDTVPNISLNSHNQFFRGQLRLIAVLATMIQSGVLVYGGFATYSFKYSKEGAPVSNYAFPCTLIGSLVLTAGLLLCAFVVESSTQEHRYQPGPSRKAHLIWLQQNKTVSDQVFDSYVIYSKDKRSIITRSVREETLRKSMVPEAERRERWWRKTGLEVRTVLGSSISMAGFIVQFTGLRGLHWSVTVLQLGAVLLLVALRAWARRGLAESPHSQKLKVNFELDWLAMTLAARNGKNLHNKESDNSNKATGEHWLHDPVFEEDPSTGTWKSFCVPAPDTHEGLRTGLRAPNMSQGGTSGDNRRRIQESQLEERQGAQRTMMLRRDLGWLTERQGYASKEAVCLARAIEVVLNTLPVDESVLRWTLKVAYRGPDHTEASQTEVQFVDFRLWNDDRGWRADAAEMEAALSLWLFSVSKAEEARPTSKEAPLNSDRTEYWNGSPGDKWLRAKEPSARQSLRLIGAYTVDLARDMIWWLPREAPKIFEVDDAEDDIEDEDPEIVDVAAHRVVGCGWRRAGEAGFASTDAKHLRYRRQDFHFEPSFPELRKPTIAVESQDSLKLLYAKDLFSSFLQSAVKSLPHDYRVPGVAQIHTNASREEMRNGRWQNVSLHNSMLDDLAQRIQSTGLMGSGEAYLSIIPPLSDQGMLPSADAVVDAALCEAEDLERLRNYEATSEIYLELFRISATFPKTSSIYVKATAALVEHLRALDMVIASQEAQKTAPESMGHSTRSKSMVLEELVTADNKLLQHLLALYTAQGRAWSDELESSVNYEANLETEYPATFNFTIVHATAMIGKPFVVEEHGDININSRDIHGWTPLHYAVSRQNQLDVLLGEGADVNARDNIGWTPLHYASQHEDVAFTKQLLQSGANASVQGKNGASALHCATAAGHLEVIIELLRAGANPDDQDLSRSTPLHIAALTGREDIYVTLWEAGKRYLFRDNMGRTALHVAALFDSVEVLECLRDVDVELQDMNNQTPLHVASKLGNVDCVRALVYQHVANLEAVDETKRTPLHLAVMGGSLQVIKCLTEAGAKIVEARDYLDQSPLDLACLLASLACVEYLVLAGAEINTGSQSLQTPLHWAAMTGNREITSYLIDSKARVDARNGSGFTPLHCAAEQGCTGAIRVLLRAGAAANATDLKRNTPLHIAAKAGWEIAAKTLVERGGFDLLLAENEDGETATQLAEGNGHYDLAKSFDDLQAAQADVKASNDADLNMDKD